MTRRLGLDFGTSNTAAGVLRDGKPVLIEVEPGRHTLPTSVFYDAYETEVLFGSAANAALIEGREGLFMRALKSVLGTSLMRETRWVGHARRSLIEVVAGFLAEVKARAEAATGEVFETALSGRPVHFHSADMARDAQAARDLEECYHLAGFRDVQFLYEPEAAALGYGHLAEGRTGLIVDIGGGTSDFTVFRDGDTGMEILASHGVRLGGTNFDKALSLRLVMPLLGQGSEIRHVFGADTHIAPNAIFQDLATWEKIPFLYTAAVRRDVADLLKLAVEPARIGRLASVLEHELGHDLAFAVEHAKIAVNAGDAVEIQLDMVEPELGAAMGLSDLQMALGPYAAEISTAASAALEMAGVTAGQVDVVVLVGGSSLMQVVEQALQRLCPGAEMARGDAFTAIADGLAIAADQMPDLHRV
ncbi:Hsp70 family protein [Rhodophyticola sp. CCM32]|uniref:Hsp70 family protein n=1 Tax=Rhodophyticola sp. CCM32 TaxID=2916397 RepID=UPI00107F4C78|nr:Hsp70 family protein [Rhodophyticola sp. CCM32]QBY01905.1 Hsp70 family protein [Rhodophyticola sp. CCM32]